MKRSLLDGYLNEAVASFLDTKEATAYYCMEM